MSTSCLCVRAVAKSDFLSLSFSFSFEHLRIDIHRDTYTLSSVFGLKSVAWMSDTNTTLEQARTKVRIPRNHRHHASCDLSHLFNFSLSHLFPPKDSYLFCFLKVRITAGVVAVAFVSLCFVVLFRCFCWRGTWAQMPIKLTQTSTRGSKARVTPTE